MQAREYQKENQIPVGGFKPGIKLSSYNIHADYLPILSTIFHIYFSFPLSLSLFHIIARNIYSDVNTIPSDHFLHPLPLLKY